MSGPPVHKPFAESCEQNKDPILGVLRELLTEPGLVLEIGSGTGQHAVYFAGRLPHLVWQPSDTAENLPGIQQWRQEAGLANVREPLELDVCRRPWPVAGADAVFSANTVHIMSWPQVECFFEGVGTVLGPGGLFCLYGPFNFDGRYTAESNARFDRWLKERDPRMGVRDYEDLAALAAAAGLEAVARYPMPADNFTLVWRRS